MKIAIISFSFTARGPGSFLLICLFATLLPGITHRPYGGLLLGLIGEGLCSTKLQGLPFSRRRFLVRIGSRSPWRGGWGWLLRAVQGYFGSSSRWAGRQEERWCWAEVRWRAWQGWSEHRYLWNTTPNKTFFSSFQVPYEFWKTILW